MITRVAWGVARKREREKKTRHGVVAAAPPLTSRSAAQGTGPPLRPQGCCASLTRRPCGPALTPETSAAPQAGCTARPRPAPRARGAPARPPEIIIEKHYNESLYGSRGCTQRGR